MIKTLTMADTVEDMSEEAAKRQKALTERIDNAVRGMEDVAGKYEGSLEKFRFGVQLWDDGTATYHASYVNREGVGCLSYTNVRLEESQCLSGFQLI